MNHTDERILEGLSLKDFKAQLKQENMSLVFSGMFSQDMLSLLGMSLRRVPNSKRLAKKLFGLVIEMTQNIRHYSAERQYSERDGRNIGTGIIAVGESEDYHVISSGNYAKPSDVDNIRARCEYVNQLAENHEELRKYYRKVRKEAQREDKPGANLGFIDMASNSGNPLEYAIEQREGENHAFFVLTLKVSKEI